jgi:hypothetical protein
VNWHAYLRPLIVKAISKIRSKVSEEDEAKSLESLAIALAGAQAEAGSPWKGRPRFVRWDEKTLEGFMGHNFRFSEELNCVLAHVPEERVLASLLNPRTKPSKPTTAIFIAYARCIALCVAGGYVHAYFETLLKRFEQECMRMCPTLNIEYTLKLAKLTAVSELWEGDDYSAEVNPFALDNGVLKVRQHPTKDWFFELRCPKEQGEVEVPVKQVVQTKVQLLSFAQVPKPVKAAKPKATTRVKRDTFLPKKAGSKPKAERKSGKKKEKTDSQKAKRKAKKARRKAKKAALQSSGKEEAEESATDEKMEEPEGVAESVLQQAQQQSAPEKKKKPKEKKGKSSSSSTRAGKRALSPGAESVAPAAKK